jgi:hypothetical protein
MFTTLYLVFLFEQRSAYLAQNVLKAEVCRIAADISRASFYLGGGDKAVEEDTLAHLLNDLE